MMPNADRAYLHRYQAMVIGQTQPQCLAARAGMDDQAQSAVVGIITFNGNHGVTIATGATVISDPLPMTVPSMTNLSVSLHVLEDGNFLTAHALSNQTNYVSGTGDFTTAAQFEAVEETPAWPLLTAIDVISTEGLTAIATVGDSITDGWGSTLSGNQRWPDHLVRRLYADRALPDFAVVNLGISGNRVTTQENPTFGENLQARFARDVLALSNISHMVLLEGINDIGMSTMGGELISADAIIAAYRQILARAHAAGIKVIAATLTPYEGAVYYSEAGEAVRRQVNDYIRHSGDFDGVIDFETVVQDPTQAGRLLPEFTEDNLHPNDAGYKAMAEAVDMSLFN